MTWVRFPDIRSYLSVAMSISRVTGAEACKGAHWIELAHIKVHFRAVVNMIISRRVLLIMFVSVLTSAVRISSCKAWSWWWGTPMDCFISIIPDFLASLCCELPPDSINIDTKVLDQTCHNLKNGVFWNATPCGSCTSRRFGGT
jgi:hypothetical protein